jgi:Core-2/I-Branching enzyme
MNLGFIILAHNQPDSIRRLTDMLATDDNRVVIHFDSGATAADKQAVQRIAAEHPDRIRVISKVHCVWGEWSLVQAVIFSLREFANMPDPPDYIHLMSGADFPLRPIADLKEFLSRNAGSDFIECCDITQRQWVKGGLSKERLRFYFPFNFRTSRNAFDRMVRWQRKLKIRRRMPLGMIPHMGSQWWTLRWSTCAALLEFIKKHPQVPRFFRSTWIPDESFFQTVIAKIIPRNEIADLQLMLHHLTPTGRPHVFYNDHLPLLRKLPHFFVRKISPGATDLYANLGLPGIRKRPIPKRKHLIHVRDLVRARIDDNHLFNGIVPGFTNPKPELKATLDEPDRMEESNRPMVLFLIHRDEQLPGLEKITRANPNFDWLGRPFAPGSVQMPAVALARIGMTEQSWKLRDSFLPQFIHLLISTPPHPRIPVAALMIHEDHGKLKSVGMLSNLVPLVVSDPPLKPHQVSMLAGMIHAASPMLNARMLHVIPSDIPGILEAISNEMVSSTP